MKQLYIDGACGISGDMFAAALLELGASRSRLDSAIRALGLEGVHIHTERGQSYSISGLRFQVHDHDHSADLIEPHEEGYHEHHHHDAHSHPHHHHEHRHLSEVCAILDRAADVISPEALALSKRIFAIIAEAEARAHGVDKSEVHFHEVGAIDSIVDILAAAVLYDDLSVKEGLSGLVLPSLTEGSGFVQTQHGLLPVPVPAVVHIAEAHGIVLTQAAVPNLGEQVTPTGIAIAAALRSSEALPRRYRILRSGVGLGTRDPGHANFLRAAIIDDLQEQAASTSGATGDSPMDREVFLLECNIDDATPEAMGYAVRKIAEAGARDVHMLPCMMKKQRPGVLLRVLTDAEQASQVEDAILRYTPTLGLLKIPVDRLCMARSLYQVETSYGPVTVKRATFEGANGPIVKEKPEYEDLVALAEKVGVPLSVILAAVTRSGS